MEEKYYKTYEIFCENFSRIIQAKTLLQAVEVFKEENPNQNVIFAEYTEFRKKESSPASIQPIEIAKMLYDKREKIDGFSNPAYYEGAKDAAEYILRLFPASVNVEQEYKPYFGWCDVDGCENEAANGGGCWRESGYWKVCTKHSAEFREGKPQPKMKQSSIDRENTRGVDGYLHSQPNSPQPKPSINVDEAAEKDADDLQVQVREHIKNHDLIDWEEMLTENEMTILENLLLTFNPLCPPGSIGFEEQKRHINQWQFKQQIKE